MATDYKIGDVLGCIDNIHEDDFKTDMGFVGYWSDLEETVFICRNGGFYFLDKIPLEFDWMGNILDGFELTDNYLKLKAVELGVTAK